jgi:hypothetical protein|uniref:RING-type domain-containing protein n=1 Tax=viral metagenome TaxID=1070528 RepID=A0A6C0CX49_9ZZZZ
MYRLSFNNLASLNNQGRGRKPVIKTQSNHIENIMKCSYCEQSGHMITDCPYDKCIDKILESSEEPEFNSLTIKTLKRIASLRGIKVSLSKIQYVLIFKKLWLTNKKEKEEEREKMKNTIESLNRINNTENTECPVCMESIGKINNCVSKCGHRFCLECLLKSYKKKNSCPLCREPLEENEYDDLPDLIDVDEDFIPFNQSEILSQENILNYIHYIENRNGEQELTNNFINIPYTTREMRH